MAQIVIEPTARHTKAANCRRLTDAEVDQWLDSIARRYAVDKSEVILFLESA